ncbi:uroporphyrinogen-III synthase [Candidatus Protochlamydia phocaeensis]|uniref:uroporphyrinogen-III synthase n=1 Tax=Candidatus Protochlamydia phocaeensis TaxID=1414722 RepID=UPI0008384C0E|nr:uroporphyrinogen-III synthase [Candidatus Protochlamydia phocaeensis]
MAADPQDFASKQILYTGLDPHHYQGKGNVTHVPLIEIVPRPLSDPAIQPVLSQFAQYTHVIVTSKSTIPILQDYLCRLGFSLQEWAQKSTLAVGRATAAHLSACGIHPMRVAKEETAEGLLYEMDSMSLKDAFFLWPHSAQSRPVLKNYFSRHKIAFQDCLLYDTLPHYPSYLPDVDAFDEIVFTSPSTVKAFVQIFGSLPAHKQLTPIGPITASCLKAYLSQSNSILLN